MRKPVLVAIVRVFSSITIFAASLPTVKVLSDTIKTEKAKPAKVQYTCKMHPEVLSDKPGKCPKCGMNLVKKKP